MSAYVVLDIKVTDSGAVQRVQQTRCADDCRVRRPVLGSWRKDGGSGLRIAPSCSEFPATRVCKRWVESSEYYDARNLRQAAATTNAIVVEGV